MITSEFQGNERHLKILEQGVEIWNRWRKENPDIYPNLCCAKLNGVNLRDADLRGTNLSGADLGEVVSLLPGMDFDGLDHLRGADLREADLSGANLGRARLCGADFSGASFRRAYLQTADLSGAHLLKAHLNWADLSRAILSDASLSEANLSGTNLFGADLREADLSGASLRGANLHGAHFSNANLGGTDLSGAVAQGTTFADIDLSVVKGLDRVYHHGRSYIDIDTIYKSHGQIPETFLRGCGVPDTFIAYMHSLTGKAFEYYSCFISYSSEDEAFAQHLHADLQARGVRCWFAPKDITGGKKLYEQIDHAIQAHEKLLLVLSEHSIGSKWVMTEIRRTRKAEIRDKRQKLFPIRLVDMIKLKDWECFDADSGKDLAVEVREYFMPDFSAWKDHDSYQRAFDHLLRDLKAEEG
jgi:uncharacterized protein YjbI with pentapeptide repeats